LFYLNFFFILFSLFFRFGNHILYIFMEILNMQNLRLEDMGLVVGGGSGGSSGNRPQNTGWGAAIGSAIGNAFGGYFGGTVGAVVGGERGNFAGGVAGGYAGGYVGGRAGNTIEKGFVAGANKAIDYALHNTNNAVANQQFGGFGRY